jgi:hypothetical protein
MADRVRKVSYGYVTVPNRAGQGARFLMALHGSGVNLSAFMGFPSRAGKAQVDVVADRLAPVRRAAARVGLRVKGSKRAFLVQGARSPGAVYRHMKRLADSRISVTAAAAVGAGQKRYGMILWVKPRDYARAARALRAR